MNARPSTPDPQHPDRGNALIFILLGVVLFSALTLVVARGIRSQSTGALSTRDLELTAVDIISTGQRFQRAVDRVRRKGYSETDLKFLTLNAGYTNANCTEDGCDIFHPGGGGMSLPSLMKGPEWVDSNWLIRNNYVFDGIGTTCTSGSCSDLIAYVRFEDESLCMKINEKLGVTAAGTTPPSVEDLTSGLYSSTFAYEDTVGIGDSAAVSGKDAACVYEDGGCTASSDNQCYLYYQVLLAR